MADPFQGFMDYLTGVMLTGVLAALLTIVAMILLPYFGSRFFYSDLTPSEHLINAVVCIVLMLFSIGGVALFLSSWGSNGAVIPEELIESMQSWIGIGLFILYSIYTLIFGVMNKDQKIGMIF